MSLTQILSNKPLRLSILTGVISSSSYFCGNLASSWFGIVPAIQHHDSLSTATKVELWKWFYNRAKILFAGSTTISALSFSTAGYLCTSKPLRRLLLCAAGSSFLVIPFTAIVMMPVNHQLLAFHDSKSSSDSSEKETNKEVTAIENIDKWERLHRIRLLLGGVAWVAGLAALAVDV